MWLKECNVTEICSQRVNMYIYESLMWLKECSLDRNLFAMYTNLSTCIIPMPTCIHVCCENVNTSASSTLYTGWEPGRSRAAASPQPHSHPLPAVAHCHTIGMTTLL